MTDRSQTFPAIFFKENGEQLSCVAYLFLFLLCMACFAPGIATLPPTDRDESSFAQASKQMIETKNYVDIRLQDKPRYKKPIGIYWLQTAAVKITSPDHLNEIWAYRIPSLLGATVAVLLTAALGSLLFGPIVGLLAAFMMAGCVVLNVEARMAKTDAALLAAIMAMQYALARAYLGVRGWRIPFMFWTAFGIGILIKGPLIGLILMSTLVWLKYKDKNVSWFRMLKPLIGIPYMLLLVAPWFIAILAASHGQFLQHSAGHDLLAKLWQGQDRGIIPPGLHLLSLPLVFFPFALFALLAIPDAWKNRQADNFGFCLGWIIPTWIVFELSLTKLPHYTLPVYPAIAMLAAKALVDGYPYLAEHRWRWLSALIIGLWLMIGTGFAMVFAVLPLISNQDWDLLQIAAGALLIIMHGVALFMLMQRKIASVVFLLAGSMVFLSCTIGHTLPQLQHVWLSREAVQLAQAVNPCDKLAIVSAAYGEPSLIFLAGTETKVVVDGQTAAEDMQKNRCLVGLIDSKHKENFLNAFAGKLQPVHTNTITSLNIGHGGTTEISLYIMPLTSNLP
ncbi:MAG: glycosyltransferase family 39 protein [Alphaproteobacteria bacterium]